MSRWLLALLFAFGSVTFLTGCPEEGGDADTETETETDGETEGDGDDEATGEGSGTE